MWKFDISCLEIAGPFSGASFSMMNRRETYARVPGYICLARLQVLCVTNTSYGGVHLSRWAQRKVYQPYELEINVDFACR